MKEVERSEHLAQVRHVQDAIHALIPAGWRFSLALWCTPPDWREIHATSSVPLPQYPEALTALAEATLRHSPGISPDEPQERKPET